MLIYITLFFLVFIILWLHAKIQNDRFLPGIAFFILFLFSALRFDVGWDYVSYFDLIERNTKFYQDQINRLEPINQMLILISQSISFTQFYFIITSFLVCILFYKVFKQHSSNFTISTILFISLPIFYFNSFSIIRQFVALSIVFYGYRYIKSQNIIKFFIVIIIAILFHRSAFVAIPLYFLFNKKIHFYFFLVIYVLGFVSSDLLYWIVEHSIPQYLKFLDKAIGQGGDKVLLLFQVLGFSLLFFINKLKMNKKENDFFFIVFFIGLFIWSSLAKYGHAGFRGSLYFMVYVLLLIPNILSEIKQRKLLKGLVYIISFLFFIFTLYLGKRNLKKDPNIPYQTFFFKDKSDLKEIK